MRRTRVFLAAVLAAASIWVRPGDGGAAQGTAADSLTTAADGAPLTEEDAVDRALSRSAEYAALRDAARVKEGMSRFLGYALDEPELRLRDIPLRSPTGKKAQNLEVGVRWRLPRPGEVGLKRERARLELWESRVRATSYRLELIAEVRDAVAEVRALRESADLADQQALVAEKRLAAVKSLVGLGQRPVLDQVKARMRLIEARREDSAWRQRHAEARSRLAELTGLAEDFVLIPAEAPPPWEEPGGTLTLDSLRACALRHSQPVQLALQRTRWLEAQIASARLRKVPWFSFLEVNYHTGDPDESWYELLLGVDLPVLGLLQGGAGEPASLADSGRRTGEGASSLAGREIEEKLAEYLQAAAEWRSLREDGAEFLSQTDHLVEEARLRGTLLADDVLDLESTALKMRRMILEARLDLARAAIELCRVVGVDSWTDLAR